MTTGEFCNRQVVIIDREATILEAARLMRNEHVGDLVVVEQRNGRRFPVGILTDRDIVVGVLAEDVEHLAVITVGDVMTEDLVTAPQHESVENTLKRMRLYGIRRIPVVDGEGTLTGIITVDDVVDLMAEQMSELAQLLIREQRREREVREVHGARMMP